MEVSTVLPEEMPAQDVADAQAPDEPPSQPPPMVALPTASIAFMQPIEGPVVLANLLSVIAPQSEATADLPVQQELKLGEGEGRQPKPEYPPEALQRRQQGSVWVQFLVDRDGNVSQVSVQQPSPWPLLNEAAVRQVRERWHFPTGPLRNYRVPFDFILNNAE